MSCLVHWSKKINRSNDNEENTIEINYIAERAEPEGCALAANFHSHSCYFLMCMAFLNKIMKEFLPICDFFNQNSSDVP